MKTEQQSSSYFLRAQELCSNRELPLRVRIQQSVTSNDWADLAQLWLQCGTDQVSKQVICQQILVLKENRLAQSTAMVLLLNQLSKQLLPVAGLDSLKHVLLMVNLCGEVLAGANSPVEAANLMVAYLNQVTSAGVLPQAQPS